MPSLYFTNLISARPLMGPAGAGSLAQVVNAAMGNRTRMDTMKSFFAGVGEGATAGVWQEKPVPRAAKKKATAKATGPVADSVVQDEPDEAARKLAKEALD